MSRQFSLLITGRRSIQPLYGYCVGHFLRCNNTLSRTREVLACMDVPSRPLHADALHHGVDGATVGSLFVLACHH
jgi:hypothetical protein